MDKIRSSRIGMRTFKTGLAVMLGVSIADLLGLRSPLFVALGVLSTLQTSVAESFLMGKNRILGTIMGALVAVIMVEYLPVNNLLLGVGLVIVIHILNILGWKMTISLSAVVFTSVYLNKDVHAMEYALHRMLDTLVGIATGVLVNYLIAAPDSSGKLYDLLIEMTEDAREFAYNLVIGKKSVDIDSFKIKHQEAESLLSMVKDDSKIIQENRKTIDKIEKTMPLIDAIHNDLASMSSMKHIAIISSKNLTLINDLYGITPILEEKAIESEEDITFNYHLQNLLHNLIRLKKDV
ncbi:MAG: aromatic acid exporter family protein [Gudongella sp.]|jgi:uncharacterized membrane protein YgaE (UPF0421/DUF939 family)|nr:aromatic acid exporter family protein [Gudongella sp.]